MLAKVGCLQSMLKATPWAVSTALVLAWTDPHRRYKLLLLLFGGAGVALVLKVLHIAMRGLCKNPLEGAYLLGSLLYAFAKTVLQFVTRGFKPIFPQWTLRFELFRIFIRVGMELYGERVLGDESYASIVREQSEWFGTFWGRKACRKAGKRYEPVKINGLEHIWLRSQTPRKPGTKRLVVLYAHGGGFAIMSPRLYIHFSNALCSFIEKELVRQLGPEAAGKVHVEIFLANYRKVPKHSYPTQPQDIVEVYEHLLYHENLDPSQVVLAGDSAGAGLIMSAMLRERRTKPHFLPLCAALLCPYVDLTGDEQPSPYCILTPECCNAVLKAYHPLIEDQTKWGDASSIHCDLRNLPPVFVQTGDLDSIHQHAVRLVAKAKADGVSNWEYDVHPLMSHVFPIFPAWFLPHADLAIEKMANFIVRQLRPTLKTSSGFNPSAMAA
ncbi:Monoterpene epsilon-lactone hydrolase [Phytophthora citrophthora]|uniref:Monoterpene epsilon-lactone hydrolase n=1 Tax=Phytophthora citrophthora TaxID=4793 RepID=A0AAD9GNU5_9STRA|nr:Monoterpene epsilon-lactone hydrolase [Phytophthora citrophthora]